GLFHLLELLQRFFYVAIRQQWTGPIRFERKQSLSEIVRELFGNEISGILPEDLDDGSLAVPTQSAPDKLIDVIVATFRVGQKTAGGRLVIVADDGFRHRPRIDALARFSHAEGGVPSRNGMLAVGPMRDVGISPDRIASRDRLADFFQPEPNLRAK